MITSPNYALPRGTVRLVARGSGSVMVRGSIIRLQPRCQLDRPGECKIGLLTECANRLSCGTAHCALLGTLSRGVDALALVGI